MYGPRGVDLAKNNLLTLRKWRLNIKKNIQFVTLSTDENKKKWFIEAKTKSKSIPQLLLENQDKFAADYNIESIPRFILIDPKGNFVNSRMPFPSESSFEIILRKALNLADEM